MRPLVRETFETITKDWEGGYIGWMFPDLRELVSTGFGILLDPVELALGYRWTWPSGRVATREEIIADFQRVKAFGSGQLGYLAFRNVAQLRLESSTLYAAFVSKLESNITVLKRGFPEFDSWSADAQLATLSMSWAVGPAFFDPGAGSNYFPKLTAALRALDFRTAAVECFLYQENRFGGLKPRNIGNRVMYTNAAIALHKLDPNELFWPASLENDTPTERDPSPPAPASRPAFTATFPIVHPEEPVEPEFLKPFEGESFSIVHPRVPLGRGEDGDDE